MNRSVLKFRETGWFNLPPFSMAYQPIVDLSTRSIVAYEALTRGPNGAGYTELVAHLNESALRAFHRRTAEVAIRQAAELGLADLNASLCINVLPDLHRDALDADFILECAYRSNLSASHILLEFTEEHRLSIPEYKELVCRNKAAGFATGIDDFGAGYSGLSALVECRPEVLKLDRTLIQGIDTSYTRQRIVAAFADCCRALDIRLIAEGIETVSDCDMLLELGVTHMQGYLFSYPIVDELPVETVSFIDPVGASPRRETRRSLLAALGFYTTLPDLTRQA